MRQRSCGFSLDFANLYIDRGLTGFGSLNLHECSINKTVAEDLFLVLGQIAFAQPYWYGLVQPVFVHACMPCRLDMDRGTALLRSFHQSALLAAPEPEHCCLFCALHGCVCQLVDVRTPNYWCQVIAPSSAHRASDKEWQISRLTCSGKNLTTIPRPGKQRTLIGSKHISNSSLQGTCSLTEKTKAMTTVRLDSREDLLDLLYCLVQSWWTCQHETQYAL